MDTHAGPEISYARNLGAKTQIITEPQIGIEPVPFLLLDKVRHGADWRMGADKKCLIDRHSMRENQ